MGDRADEIVPDIGQLSKSEKACVLVDLIVNAFDLHPQHLDMNFSRALSGASPRTIEIFEQDLPELTQEQRLQLAQILLDELREE